MSEFKRDIWCGSCVHFLAYEFTDRADDTAPVDLCVNPKYNRVIDVTPLSGCGNYEPNDGWSVMALYLLAYENNLPWSVK